MSTGGIYDIGGQEYELEGGAIVPAGGRLPLSYELATGKLLDIILGFFPQFRDSREISGLSASSGSPPRFLKLLNWGVPRL